MEVELKFPAPDNIEQLLIAKGAKKVSEQHEKDVHYDREGELLEQGKTLRIRHTGSEKILTFKGPQTTEGVKALDEFNLPVKGDAEEILGRLGFTEDEVVTKEKHRTTYELDGITVNIDDVKKLGRFVELELITDNAEEGKERLYALADRLALPRDQAITLSYPEMLREINTRGD